MKAYRTFKRKLDRFTDNKAIYRDNSNEINEQYKLLIDLSPIAIFVHDTKTILFANPAAAKLLGAAVPQDLVGLKTMDFVHADNHQLVKERMYRMSEGRNCVPPIEEKFIRLDGSIIDVEVTATPFPYKGVTALLVIVRDIAERKKAEEFEKAHIESARLLNEAIEYDRIKTEFFANISHELRTPLNVLFGSVQLLDFYYRSNHIQSEAHDLSKHFKSMTQNCYRLLRLLNNLIDITKIDSGYLKPNLLNCNIVSIIEEITLSVVEYAEHTNITLLFDTDIEEKYMNCDPEKVERIMLNLLSNAIKFTNPGGSIIVNVNDKGSSVVISIKDTGIGIPYDKLDIIFERFRQVDRLLTRQHEGSGIGLSIVRSLVEMHNGTINVVSEYGKGSEFIIELPANLPCYDNHISDNRVVNNIQKSIENLNIEFSDIFIKQQ